MMTVCPMMAKDNIGSMFVDVCMNFVPFLTQVSGYLLGVQPFPGAFTAYGAACLYVGCTLLAMTYGDRKALVTLPIVGRFKDEPLLESLLGTGEESPETRTAPAVPEVQLQEERKPEDNNQLPVEEHKTS